jgi:CRP/FNR family cyclic AMP-dependent transcriptional regulator
MTAPETDTLSFLESHIVFHGIPEQDLAIIYPFLEFETFAADTAIIEEDTTGKALYVITTGSASVVKSLPDEGDSRVLATLSQGDCFGEMEILDTMKRSASVITTEETKCLVLSTGILMKIYGCRPEAYPIIVLNIARELSRRLRLADARIAELEDELSHLKSDTA